MLISGVGTNLEARQLDNVRQAIEENRVTWEPGAEAAYRANGVGRFVLGGVLYQASKWEGRLSTITRV